MRLIVQANEGEIPNKVPELLEALAAELGHFDPEIRKSLLKAAGKKRAGFLPDNLRYKAMQGAVRKARDIYGETLASIKAGVGRIIEGATRKGSSGLMETRNLHQIDEIITDAHIEFVFRTLGPKALDSAGIRRAKDLGAKQQMDLTEEAWVFGKLLASGESPQMKYDELQRYARNHRLDATERGAVDIARMRAANLCRGLGNKISSETGTLVIEADQDLRNRMITTIRGETAENIARRGTLGELRSALGGKTEDFARDFMRIAITETQNSVQQSQANQFVEDNGPDARVAKLPAPDACEACKRLHLEGGKPKIFSLSELAANGTTNAGRKRSGWLAVVGSTHPGCTCELLFIPTGMEITSSGEMVVIPKDKDSDGRAA